MKAWIYEAYGGPEQLRPAELPVPEPRENELLVRVHAVSLNGSDKEGLTGFPAYARIGGFRRPRRQILGSDIAGVVEAVGAKVTRFKPGDRVFGDNLDRMGGFAEFARAGERAMAPIPDGLGFEDAAALPQGAVIALQGMRKAKLRPGSTVLVNGAGGSAGSFAVQLARLGGAEITGVDNAGKAEFVRSLGADHFIDYEREDFWRAGKQYDVIFDVFAREKAADYVRALKRGGSYFYVGGPVRRMLALLAASPLTRLATGRRIRLLMVRPNTRDLLEAADMVRAGPIRPAIGAVFPFDRVPDAMQALVEGTALGKVVVRVV